MFLLLLGGRSSWGFAVAHRTELDLPGFLDDLLLRFHNASIAAPFCKHVSDNLPSSGSSPRIFCDGLREYAELLLGPFLSRGASSLGIVAAVRCRLYGRRGPRNYWVLELDFLSNSRLLLGNYGGRGGCCCSVCCGLLRGADSFHQRALHRLFLLLLPQLLLSHHVQGEEEDKCCQQNRHQDIEPPWGVDGAEAWGIWRVVVHEVIPGFLVVLVVSALQQFVVSVANHLVGKHIVGLGDAHESLLGGVLFLLGGPGADLIWMVFQRHCPVRLLDLPLAGPLLDLQELVVADPRAVALHDSRLGQAEAEPCPAKPIEPSRDSGQEQQK
mmetsp:Transcript_3263/g.7632  ORF Transcript_3263/g.7632 Transcript_3263/m.7632 type:complete len:327 (-) Transcript_3263:18-998(-)